MSIQYSTGSLFVASGIALIFDHIEDEGEMWFGAGERWSSVHVPFEDAFDKPPVIQLSIEMIDADHARNLRLQLRAEDVKRTGFRAVAYTWKDTRIGRLSVSWMAIGKTGSEWDV